MPQNLKEVVEVDVKLVAVILGPFQQVDNVGKRISLKRVR